MQLDMDIPNKPTTAEEIAAFETRLGRALPKAYKAFLLTQNGGLPARSLFRYDGRRKDSVNFYGVGVATSYNNIDKTLTVFAGRIPDGFLAIGDDPGGNQICMSLDEPGAMYLWDHEREADEGQPPTMANMHPSEPSFEAFINSLEADPNDEDW
ncbi:SMI1/KNR4 family protein [Halovulum sp. GXIMD14793]